MTYLNMSGYNVGLCRGLSGFRGLSRFVGVCRAWGLHYALCVCACACVGVFVEVFRGLSGFVGVCRAWGLHDACICNCKLYIVPSKYCFLSLKVFKNI